jgi:hypothetical protein
MKKEMATVFKQSLGLSVVYATCCYLYNKGYYMGRQLSSDVLSGSASVWLEVASILPCIL